MFRENTITTLKVDIQGKAALVVQSINLPVYDLGLYVENGFEGKVE